MKKIVFAIAMTLGFLSTNINACIRIDLGDRSKEEVLEKSLFMAKSKIYHGNVTGVLLFCDIEEKTNEIICKSWGTGIAVNRSRILTAAHLIEEEKNYSHILFSLEPNITKVNRGNVYSILPSNIFIHPSYKDLPNPELSFSKKNEKLHINSIPIDEINSLSYEMFEKSFTSKNDLNRVDLAILKLNSFLPESLEFPEILQNNFEINNTYSVSIGYGDMMYNFQEGGASLINENIVFKRHLITHKVTHKLCRHHGDILYGKYETKFGNKASSFIPKLEMLKTEGVPVCGDSGGSLLIEDEGKYKLAGIYSLFQNINTFDMHEEIKKTIPQDKIKMPNFYIWTDIRPHIDLLLKLSSTDNNK